MGMVYQRSASSLSKVKVEWPSHLATQNSPSPSWLAVRKPEAEKRQQEKMDQAPANPWLPLPRHLSYKTPQNLPQLVREGLLKAAGKEEEKKIEERVPFPMCEDVAAPKEDPMEEVVKRFINPIFAPKILPVPKEGEPWNPPKSPAMGVREGLLKARDAGVEAPRPAHVKSIFTNTQAHLTLWLNKPKEEVMDSTRSETSSPNMMARMLQATSISNDQWVVAEDDNKDAQSEGSIITLTNSDVTIEDFDDFADMEHELSQWISRA